VKTFGDEEFVLVEDELLAVEEGVGEGIGPNVHAERSRMVARTTTRVCATTTLRMSGSSILVMRGFIPNHFLDQDSATK
jgi:hypothetical protein